MKKFGFFISVLLASSLLIIGCDGGSSNESEDTVIEDTVNFPVITILEGNLAYNVGEVYVEYGATAEDVEDGDLTDQIVTVSTVDTGAVGTYTVTYTVTDSTNNTTTAVRTVEVREVLDPVVTPPDSSSLIEGTALDCVSNNLDDNVSNDVSDDANETNASKPFKKNISSNPDELVSRKLQTSHNTPEQLDMVMVEMNADGDLVGTTDEYHPIAVSYLEQVDGDEDDYEMGDGSADIGDPDNVDAVKVSLTRDNGHTWKDYNVSNSTGKSSIEVVWNNVTIAYPGHAQKPDMAINGQNILVAWNDKYCPSGNPLGLASEEVDGQITYPTDLFAVNGPQNYVDYEGIVAPNGKIVYQVPFSCVWTARGTIDPDTADITWHVPMQLTTGTRDTNHIWVAGSGAGFAIAWQEDTLGLKAGEGAGPGDGWSGATGNRGTDIWYTSIKSGTEFTDTNGTIIDTKPVSKNNFHYPVRITDNEQCQATDKKVYCDYFCGTYGTITSPKGNQSGEDVTRCLTYDTDMLTDTVSILDGDTGASRSALKILKTNVEGEYVVVLGYEETKALKVRVTGEGDQDQGDIPTDIALEGKSVYFESFDFNAIDAFDETNISATMQNVAMPLVSAGNIINVRVEDQNDSNNMIFENARRLVIGTQIDSCDANETEDLTFSILYKQSFEVQGASSDMFVRTNRGFNYSDFAALDGREVTNVSAQNNQVVTDPKTYVVDWNETNLDDNTYDNGEENTFSPRLFLRGANIYVGFEYTPNDTQTQHESMPSNFHTNLYIDGAWKGPVNITQAVDKAVTTVDARFFTTPKGSYDTTALESDKSNPNVLFVTWGTLEGTGDDRAEADLFFKRSTDNGETWEDEQNLSSIAGTTIEEKEVESFASADGKTIYNVWLQQSKEQPKGPDALDDGDIWRGLDSWFGRVDYNISK